MFVGPLADAQALAQVVDHLVHRHGRVVDTDVAVLQRLAAGIGAQQEGQQPGRIVGVDPVGIQRRLADHPVTLAHLVEQPFPPRTVDAGQAHAGSRYPAVQRDLLGVEHDPSGIGLGKRRRLLVDPAAIGLRVDPGAGDEQQAPGPLAVGLQPAQHMAQAVDVGGTVASLVVLTGGGAVHQVVERLARPLRGTLRSLQIASHRQDPLRQGVHRATQAMDPPAIGQQCLAEAPADIAAAGDHHCLRHEAVSFLQQGGQCRRRIVCNARPIMPPEVGSRRCSRYAWPILTDEQP